ncbi:hypothetical protein Y030_5514 [Burkholderia pseudomallei MSHR332]|nr:hypothetical protein Y030_5514 [Burkholderia pseudomallei MSHR332]
MHSKSSAARGPASGWAAGVAAPGRVAAPHSVTASSHFAALRRPGGPFSVKDGQNPPASGTAAFTVSPSMRNIAPLS